MLWPRRRRDSSPWTIHVLAAASRRPCPPRELPLGVTAASRTIHVAPRGGAATAPRNIRAQVRSHAQKHFLRVHRLEKAAKTGAGEGVGDGAAAGGALAGDAPAKKKRKTRKAEAQSQVDAQTQLMLAAAQASGAGAASGAAGLAGGVPGALLQGAAGSQ